MFYGEKTCPLCGRKYLGGESYCIADGAALVEGIAGTTGSGEHWTDPDGLDEAGGTGKSGSSGMGPLENARPDRRPGLPKETLVGLAMVVAVLVLFVGVLLVQKSSQFRLFVVFESGQNIRPGDKVFVQGHESGSVDAAGFEDDKFVATITIRPDARRFLRSDSIFYVGHDQFLTNKRCIVVATSNDPSAPLLENGQFVRGSTWLPGWAKQQISKFLKPIFQ